VAQAIIETHELTKHHGAFTALDSVSFELPEGSVTGLLGPNGAGKTTLMKTLLGFLPSTSGSCTVLGESLSKAPLTVRQRVGFMPENDAFFPDRTGLESVVYAGRLTGMPTEAAFSRAYEVLDYLGMDEVRHRPITGYSVGLKQKIKLGQALVHGPKLCFLDEPLSGLDPKSRDEMMELLIGIGKSGVSMVISSHVLKDVETLCSTLLMLNRGKLLYSGTLADLRRQNEGRYAVRVRGDHGRFTASLQSAGATAEQRRGTIELELPGGQDVSTIWQAANDARCQIRELRHASDSLEQAFLRLLGEKEVL
jgi:ABC-2 type transport system ATP-binding protein